MNRRAVIAKLRAEAKSRHLDFEVIELTRHTAIRLGQTTRTLSRGNEIDDVTARRYFDQFAPELGKGWWR